MERLEAKKHIAVLGGGPAGLFLFKRLVESGCVDMCITIIERKDVLGAGMPYSPEGACNEHITNVSGNEIPELVNSLEEWIKTAPQELLQRFGINSENYNDYKVVPRLLFGQYLSAQFEKLLLQAKKEGIETDVLLNTSVVDLIDEPKQEKVKVVTANGEVLRFDAVAICTGHHWPKRQEGTTPNYFDSPYPPSKLHVKANYPVAIRGASLTAYDAVRTLARANGRFHKTDDGKLHFEAGKGSENFRLVLHSLDGLLPAIRFHLGDPQLSKDAALGEEELHEVMRANDGFVPLDYLFNRNYKLRLRETAPAFYEQIKDMRLEEFVEHMMGLRERLDAFQLFKAEYAEAEKSIRRRQSVHWKEELASLSYAMNYPAKHLSAEDMLRLKKSLMPLISIVIAFVPQSSCLELLALYEAGVLSLTAVDRNSKVEPLPGGGAVYRYTDEEGQRQEKRYGLFVDAIGQPQFSYAEFPFKTLREEGTVSAARLRFRSAEAGAEAAEKETGVTQDGTGGYWLTVPGIAINDRFQVLDQYGVFNPRLYVMAVPYIGGYNPDYSGLDFCEAASAKVADALLEKLPVTS